MNRSNCKEECEIVLKGVRKVVSCRTVILRDRLGADYIDQSGVSRFPDF